MQSCLLNPYKRGRINAFVAAEKAYGFARIIQWMKEGEGDHIDTKNLAGHSGSAAASRPKAAARRRRSPPAGIRWHSRIPAAKYTNTVLKGIPGTALRRFALIDGDTFAPNETGKVRIGGSNVMLRCLEIPKLP